MNAIYSERGTPFTYRTLSLALLSGIAASVIGTILHPVLLILGIIVFSSAITLMSVNYYTKLVISENVILVGKDKVKVVDLDSDFGAKTAEEGLTQDQYTEMLNPFPFFPSGEIKMLGGSYGKTETKSMIVIKKNDDPIRYVIQCSNQLEAMNAINNATKA